LQRVLQQNTVFKSVLDRRIELWVAELAEQDRLLNNLTATASYHSLLDGITLSRIRSVPGANNKLLKAAARRFELGGDAAEAIPEITSILARHIDKEYFRSALTDAFRVLGFDAEASSIPELLAGLSQLISNDGRPLPQAAATAAGSLEKTAETAEIMAGSTGLRDCGVKNAAEPAAAALAAMQRSSLKEKRKPGPVTPDEIKHICEQLDNADIREVRSGCVEIIEIGEDAATTEILAALAKLLVSKGEDKIKSAMDAIRGIGPGAATTEILAALIGIFKERGSRLWAPAAEALMCVSALDSRPESRVAFAKVFEKDDTGKLLINNSMSPEYCFFRDGDKFPVLRGLGHLLGSKDRPVREKAVEALYYMGAAAGTEEMNQTLAALVQSADDGIAGDAAEVAQWIGADSPKLLMGITALAHRNSPKARRQAAESVAYVGGTKEILDVRAALAGFSKSPDLTTANEADATIALMDSILEGRIDEIANALGSESCTERSRAVRAVRHLGEIALTNSRVLAGLVDALVPDVSEDEQSNFMTTPYDLHNDNFALMADAAVAIGELGPAALADKRVLPALARNLSMHNEHWVPDKQRTGIVDHTDYDRVGRAAREAFRLLVPSDLSGSEALAPLVDMLQPNAGHAPQGEPTTQVDHGRAAADAITLLGLHSLANAAVADAVAKNPVPFLRQPHGAARSIIRAAQFRHRLVALLDQPQS
jgi:hypothetical protein